MKLNRLKKVTFTALTIFLFVMIFTNLNLVIAYSFEDDYKKTSELNSQDVEDKYQKNYQEETHSDGSYILKSAEWVDKENGEALITIKASQVAKEKTTALYVATMCYSHGLTEDILVENIITLIKYYDYVDFIGINNSYESGITATKRFTSDSTETEIRDYVKQIRSAGYGYPHYINSVPVAIQKYLFGGKGDSYISEENMINDPIAIYVSCDSMYLRNTSASDIWGKDYATEKYFNFMAEKYNDRYFSMSQSSQQDTSPKMIIRYCGSSTFDENLMNILIGVLNPKNYGEANSLLSQASLDKWQATTGADTSIEVPFADKKYAAQYSYSKNFEESGVKIITNCTVIDTVVDEYNIFNVEATTNEGDVLPVELNGQKVTITDSSYTSGKEITVKIHVRLKPDVIKNFEDFTNTNVGSASVTSDFNNEVLTVESPKLVPVTSNYTVNYIDRYTGQSIKTSKVEKNIAINTQINTSNEVVDISGYTYYNADKNSITVSKNESENVIDLYYSKNTNLVVNYIDKNSNQLLNSYTEDGYYGKDYTTSAKEFEKYVLVEEPKNKNGKMEYDGTVVNYYYMYTSNLNIKYIDENTGLEIATSVSTTLKENDKYNTTPIDISDYQLVTIPSNASGVMGREDVEVVYGYKKISAGVLTRHIDTVTKQEIAPSTLQSGLENDDYTTSSVNINGYVLEVTPSNATGKMTVDQITVTYEYRKKSSVTVKYVDIKTNESLVEEDVVIKGLQGDNYDTEQKEFEGYKYVRVDGEVTGQMGAEPTTVTYYYIKQSKVVTKYIDKNTGKEIEGVEREERVYSEGDRYTTVRKTIEGYTYVEDSQNITGEVGREDIEVIYYYKKNTGITVKYIDMYENTEISGTESKTGLEGDRYTTEQKEIPGYRFVEVEGQAEGKMQSEPIEVVYKYVKQSKVTVYHKDENTNEILIADMPVEYDEKAKYTTSAREIEGYTLTGDTGNTSGEVGRENIEVTYYYKKNTKVTVKYIDMVTGESIEKEEVISGLERDEYETVKKEIEGYEYVETEGKANGQMEANPTEVIYKYKKVSKLITEHIDANTNEKIIENIEKTYKEGDRYEALAQNLEGYVLVESPEETTGVMGRENITKTFYYKKISAGLTVKYVDKITGELLDQKEYSGNEKDVIELEEKDFKYYILSSKPDFSQVELTVEPQEVVYYYIRTSKVEIEGIDQESGEVLYQGEVSGLEGDKYETYPREIEGYELVKIPDNQNGTYKRNNEKVVYEYRKIAGKVEVKYVDDETGEILGSYEIEGKVGENYKTEKREYEGYRLVKVEGEESGVLEREGKEVIYHYERKTGTLVVKYIDEEGKEILKEESKGKVGEKYKVEEKEIEGYEIIKRPESLEGEYKEGETELVFVVKQKVVVEPIEKGTIKVNFVDKEGNKLLETYIEEGEEGKEFYMEAPEIEGYKIVGEREIRATFVAGEIVFEVVYEKVPEEMNVDTGDINIYMLVALFTLSAFVIVRKISHYKNSAS